MNAEKWSAFVRMMQDAYWLAEKSANCCFDDSEEDRREDKCSALSYAAACTARYSAAEAIYWMSPEIMQLDLSLLFAKFDAFVHEVQTDYETNHSRQWVDKEFSELKALFEDFKYSQPESD